MIVSATALSEKVPDPELRPHGFALRRSATCSTSTRPRPTSSRRATSASTRSRSAASSRSAAACSTSTRRPRSARSASTCSTSRSSRCAGSRPSRSARSARPTGSRSRPPPSSPPSIASWPRSPRRRRSAATSPSCCRSTASASCSTSSPSTRRSSWPARRTSSPPLRDHWDDVCAAFHDRGRPSPLRRARRDPARRCRSAPRCGSSSISGDQPIEIRGQAADFAARSLREAETELEKLTRSGYTTVVAWPQRGAAERAAYNLARLKAELNGGTSRPGLHRGEPARRLRRAGPQARGVPRAPADPPPQGLDAADAQGPRPAALVRRPAHRRHRRPRGPRHRPLRRLRHEDGDGRHARLPRARVRQRQGVDAHRHARQDLALRRRGRRAPVAQPHGRLALGDDEGARPPRRAGARRRAAQPLRRAPPPPRPRLPGGLRGAARARVRLPVPRDARPARRDRRRDGRHGGRAADGPADLRRRRLRQDRGRAARRGQGRLRRQAGDDARADDDPRAAALRHLRRAPARPAVHDRARLALPPGGRAARGDQALLGGQGRHPRRHAPAALARRAREGPRAADRRRGAALRRQAEGAAAPAAPEGRRDRDVGHADPAHAADEPRRAARHLGDRDAAGGPPSGQDLRRRVRRAARAPGARARGRARRAGVLPAQPRRRHRGDRRAPARAVPAALVLRRPRADGREAARGPHAALPARRRRRADLDQHHRVGHRHPAGQHADRRPRGPLRPQPALPDPRPRRAAPASGPTPTCCIRAPPR